MSQQFGMTKAIELMHAAKAAGAKRVSFGMFEVEFFKLETAPVEPLALEDDAMPTEDELLYWSTPYEPDIKAHPPQE